MARKTPKLAKTLKIVNIIIIQRKIEDQDQNQNQIQNLVNHFIHHLY